MQKDVSILNLEDNAYDAELNHCALLSDGIECKITRVETRESFLDSIESNSFDLILADYSLPSFDGLEALALARERRPHAPFIFVSGALGEEVAIEALKNGATDYVLKDRLARLAPAVRRALKEQEQRVERERAEKTRRAQSEFLQTVFESISQPFYVVDTKNYEVVMANSSARKCIVDGPARCYELAHGGTLPCDGVERQCPMPRVMETKKSVIVEQIHHDKNGLPRTVEVHGHPVLDEHGEVVQMIEYCVDITDRRQLEAQLQQAQKMEAIGTLVGGIAHDFNNILSAICGNLDLALDDVPRDACSLRESLTETAKATERATDLVRQILALSRQTQPERISLCLNSLVKEVAKLLRASIPVTIEMKWSVPEKPITVYADATQIHQVLMNLCTNAYHAMKEQGGLMRVDLTCVDVRDETPGLPEPGAWAKLTVSDTGIGIDPLIRDKIFDPFFTTKPRGEGTGLGLSVVHGIVESHGGSIQVRSKVEQGTTFDVFLPLLIEESHADEETIIPKDVHGRGERVLFVDDDESIVSAMQRQLYRLGYNVVAATDSVGALETFRKDPWVFDVVICDQTMPRLTGSEMAMAMLRLRRNCPIILCTGQSERAPMARIKEHGVFELLRKPVKKQILAETIRRALESYNIKENPER
jgi:signal transduction histidine kinase